MLAGLLVLALLGAAGAFVLSERGGGSTSSPRPSIFPAHFSEPGFLTGEARLVTSYDAAATSRRLIGSVVTPGSVYVVAKCTTGTLHVVVGGLTSDRPCTGSPTGVVALSLTQRTPLTATVATAQTSRWGIAIYQ